MTSFVLDNIRSAYNVGSIFRIAASVGIDSLILVGITATPEHRKVAKTALGATSVPWHHVESIQEAIGLLDPSVIPIALEITPHSENLFSIESLPSYALILGNEVAGVSTEALQWSKRVVAIPHYGPKESLNVSVAAGIAAYEFKRKSEHFFKR